MEKIMQDFDLFQCLMSFLLGILVGFLLTSAYKHDMAEIRYIIIEKNQVLNTKKETT